MSLKIFIRDVIRRFGYEVTRIGEIDLLESLIYKKNHKDFFFIQIGANNGQRFDPIFKVVKKLKLRGIALEPIKEYYNELRITYKNSNVLPVNKAIFEENRAITMYRVKREAITKEWEKGIASLSADHYKKSKTSVEKIVEETVEAITFEKLIADYNVNGIDLLQIDAEGYDYNLLKLFPFDKFQPSIINFEHGLTYHIMTQDQLSEIISMLISHGYKILMKEYDCIAYK